jgi:hypothetical protein
MRGHRSCFRHNPLIANGWKIRSTIFLTIGSSSIASMSPHLRRLRHRAGAGQLRAVPVHVVGGGEAFRGEADKAGVEGGTEAA